MLNRSEDIEHPNCIPKFSEGWEISNISVLSMIFTIGRTYNLYQAKTISF